MKFNYDLLRGRIYNRSSVPEVAKSIGVSPATLRRKLSGKPFKSDEIIAIAKMLDINISDSEELGSYFFNHFSSQNRTKVNN